MLPPFHTVYPNPHPWTKDEPGIYRMYIKVYDKKKADRASRQYNNNKKKMNTLPLFQWPLEYLTYDQHHRATYKLDP